MKFLNPTALPGRIEALGDRSLDALVRIRDDQLDAAQATPCQLAQGLRLVRFWFRGHPPGPAPRPDRTLLTPAC